MKTFRTPGTKLTASYLSSLRSGTTRWSREPRTFPLALTPTRRRVVQRSTGRRNVEISFSLPLFLSSHLTAGERDIPSLMNPRRVSPPVCQQCPPAISQHSIRTECARVALALKRTSESRQRCTGRTNLVKKKRTNLETKNVPVTFCFGHIIALDWAGNFHLHVFQAQ